MVEFLEERVIMFMFYPLTLTIPFLVFLFFLYKWHPSHGKNLPPSPPKLPVIGNLHQIGGNPHRSFKTLSQRYGDLMIVHLGSKPTLVISSKEMVSKALKAHDHSFSGRPTLAISKSPLFYNCKELVLSQYGERWRRLRSICVLQLFSSKRVKSFRGNREEEVAFMIEKIKKSKSAVNLTEMLFTFTNNLICKAAFGRTYISGEEGKHNFEKLIDGTISAVGNSNIEDVIPWMGWINRFNGVNANINKLSKGLDDVVERIIKEHVDRLKEAKEDTEENETYMDFVDILLDVQRNDPSNTVRLEKEDIKAVIFDMFVAGTHTNHVTMEWTFTELLRNPRIMKRLQEEVRRIVGAKEFVSEEDLEKMSYLKLVIKESFRFHPATPLPAPRELIKDVKLNGYDIAKGTQVFFNAWAIARDPRYWEEPEKFIPERFLNSSIDFKGQHFELLPFGGGRRGCPAISFSIAGIELALANLVYRFDWSLPNGEKSELIDISESTGSIPHKKTPLVVVATPWVPKEGATKFDSH